MVHGNIYFPRGGEESVLSITIDGNGSVARLVTPLVTLPFLNIFMIH